MQIFLFLLTLIVYLTLPARLYFGEGIKWAIILKDGWAVSQFHPHHLFYNPAGLVLHQLVSLFKQDINPIFSLLLLDALFGAAGAALFFRTALMATGHRVVALAASLGLAFSWGYWSHSHNVEVYIPSCFFLLLVLHRVLKSLLYPGSGGWMFTGIILAVACLFHQSNIFYLPVPVIGLMFQSIPLRQKLKNLFQCVMAAGLLTALSYLSIAILIRGDRSVAQIQHWILQYGYTVSDYYWRFTLSSLKHAYRSLQIIFMDALPSALGITSRFLPDALLSAMKWTAFCLAGFLIVFRPFRGWIAFWDSRKKFFLICVVSILSQGLFFTFWDPGGWFFWIQHLAPLWLLLAMAAAWKSGAEKTAAFRKPAFYLLVTVIFLVNLFNSVIPLHDSEGVSDARYLNFLTQRIAPRDLALFTDTGVKVIPNFGGPLPYLYCKLFAPFEMDALHPYIRVPEGAEALAQRIRNFQARGSRVFWVTHVKRGKGLKNRVKENISGFFEKEGFILNPAAVYEEDTVYQGNTLYRIMPQTPAVR